jgi:hypothetical protein
MVKVVAPRTKAILPRTKDLAAPFVVTVASAVFVANAGCSVSVTENGSGPKLCPSSIPSSGDRCDQPELRCGYGAVDRCNQQATVRCTAGLWSGDTKSCNPPGPPVVCPDIPPVFGDQCTRSPVSCTYAKSQTCTATDAPLVCGANGTWTTARLSALARACPAMPVVGTACGGNCPNTLDDACVYSLTGDITCPPSFFCVAGTWQTSVLACNSKDAGSEDGATP